MSDAKQSDALSRQLSLLERPAPDGYLQEWEKRLRDKPEEEVKDTRALLVFRVSQEWLALRASSIAEITADAPVHRVPHRTNDVLRGIVNVRGELQLSFSLKSLLGLREGSAPQMSAGRVYPRLIVLQLEGERFVTRVDEVMGVSHFETGTMQTVPVTVSKALATFSRGLFDWHERKVALLDDELIFHSLQNQHL